MSELPFDLIIDTKNTYYKNIANIILWCYHMLKKFRDSIMGKNIGEIDELKAKLSLIYWRDNRMHGISNVGFYDLNWTNTYIEYPSHAYNPTQISTMQTQQLCSLCSSLGISKSPSGIKADVVINQDKVSLKSKGGALPALLNHTNRSGIEKVFNRIQLPIQPLDSAINDYWMKRMSGIIREDVKMNDLNSPFSSIKISTMVPLLSYFLFTGTGIGDSAIPANVVWEMSDPTDFSTWQRLTLHQVSQTIVDSTVISLRSKKGMPKNYSGQTDTPINASIAMWTRYWQGEYRGALHIRG